MSKIPNYEKATNAAYNVLKDYEGPFPHVDIMKILRQNNDVKLHTYAELSKLYGVSITQLENNHVPSYHGFTIFNKSQHKWIVYYNETKPCETLRFTLAHELGHIILEHSNDDDVDRKEADCFARNLLCPVPLRDAFNVSTIKDYSQCFNISEIMAEITKSWNSSDEYYISQDNYNSVNERIFCYFSGYTPTELYGY